MIGKLTEAQIDQVLHQQLVGRLACYSGTRLYIVPINYVFETPYIYCVSQEGQKISVLRGNPEVCFQADIIDDMANWRSVILWGTFEELTHAHDLHHASQLLRDRFQPIKMGEQLRHQPEHVHPPQVVEKQSRAIHFRIRVTEKTGRYEKNF